jgi:hypothetical protein
VVDPFIRFLVIDAIGSKPGIISLLRTQRLFETRDRMRLAIGGLTLIVQARLTATLEAETNAAGRKRYERR